MRVLAFDPGFERLGIAVVEKKSSKESLLFSDCVRTSTSLSFPERLGHLGSAVETLVKQWGPDAVALEQVFFEKNAKTAMQVARVMGMLGYIATSRKIPMFEYTPAEVKIAITGNGRGDKRAVALMVPRLVDLPKKKRLDDELDAIAIGLTCLASVRR